VGAPDPLAVDDRGCVKVGDMAIELVKLGGGATFALRGKNTVGDCTVMKSRKKAPEMRGVMTSEWVSTELNVCPMNSKLD
jgi:hypothetical protein